MASANNPRKFSEKIALHNQKQAEETAAFEEVMMELTNSRLQGLKVQQLRLSQTRGQYYGGSLPNVNAISSNAADFQDPFSSGLDSNRGTRHHGLVERVQIARLTSPHRRQVDSSPYSSAYLPLPPDSSWRRNALPWCNFPAEKGNRFGLMSALSRTNSDSALHTSVTHPSAAAPFPSAGPTPLGQSKKSGLMDGDLDSLGKAFSYSVLPMDNLHDEDKSLSKVLWDTQKVQSDVSRPKSCEVPGISKGRLQLSDEGTLLTQEGAEETMVWSTPANLREDMWRRGNKMSIFSSPDGPCGGAHLSAALSTGGSLPDLTNLHFPSPLPTPLDPEEAAYGSSTANRGRPGLCRSRRDHAGYQPAGLSSSLQGSLSNMSLQSSLSNPSLQSSLSASSLHSSLSASSLQSSLSNPSLGPAAGAGAKPGTPVGASPRRRGAPLNPLTLSAADTRRAHAKQFSPTMSPTLSSIAQGIPLDTSSLSDQRLPPYPFCQQPAFQQTAFPQSQPAQQTQFPPSQSSHPTGYSQSQSSQQTTFPSSQSQQTAFPQSQSSQQTVYPPPQSQQTGYSQSQSNQQAVYPPSQSQQTGYSQSQSQQTAFPQSQSNQQAVYPTSQSQQTAFPQSQSNQQAVYPPSQSQQTAFPQSQSNQQTGYSQSQQTGYSQSQSQQTAFPQSQSSHPTQLSPSQSAPQTTFPQSQSNQQTVYSPSQSQQSQSSHPTQFPQSQQRPFPQSQSNQQTAFPQSQSSQQTAFPQSQSNQQTAFPQSQSQQTAFPQSQSNQQTAFPQTQSNQQTSFPQSQSQQTAFPQSQSSQQTAFPQSQSSQQTAYPQSQSTQQTAYPQSQSSQQTGHHQTGFQQSQLDYQQTDYQQKLFQQNFQQQPSPRTALSYKVPAGVGAVPARCGDAGRGPMPVGSGERLQEEPCPPGAPLLNKHNLFYCSRVGPIPNIILTGDSPPGLSKEIANALAGMPGFGLDPHYPLDEGVGEPLTLASLTMLSDPDLGLLSDPSLEDSFRADRL